MAVAVFFWVVLGLLVAGDFKVVFRDNERGWVPLLLAGAAGAVIAGYLRGAIFGFVETGEAAAGFAPGTILLCILGAGILVVITNKMLGRPEVADVQHRRAA